MALRLIEIVLNDKDSEKTSELIKGFKVLEYRQIKLTNNDTLIRILLEAEQSEPILDLLEKRFIGKNDYRLITIPVEATIPRPPEPLTPAQIPIVEKTPERIAREELYEDVKDGARCSKVYITMLILSTIVAIVGFNKNNMVVIIGAMLISPMFGPNMALSLGTTLGDAALLWRAFRTNLVGILVVLALSVIVGAFADVNPVATEIASRSTTIRLEDILLALVSGCAGALALTKGISSTLVGVMVAVALLPSLVAFGLLLGGGQTSAISAAMLFMVNLISINLAGITTFLLQGIRPTNWWEKTQAKKATTMAIGLWVILLLGFIGIILLPHL